MARPDEFECAVGTETRLRCPRAPREPRLRLHDVEGRRDADRAFQVVRPRTKRVGQREQDAPDLLGFALFQFDQLVVDVHRAQWFEEQAGTAGGRAVHDAWNRTAVLGLHHEHVAAVTVGDHLVLQVLRCLAFAQEAVESRSQAGALLPQPLADNGEGRTGIVGHVTAGFDLPANVGNLVPERRHPFDQPHQIGERGPGLRHRAPRLLDGFEELRESEQPQRLQGTSARGQRLEGRFEFRRRAQRKSLMRLEEPHAFRGGAERCCHPLCAGQRRQHLDLGSPHRRDGELRHRGHDAVELERAKSA